MTIIFDNKDAKYTYGVFELVSGRTVDMADYTQPRSNLKCIPLEEYEAMVNKLAFYEARFEQTTPVCINCSPEFKQTLKAEAKNG